MFTGNIDDDLKSKDLCLRMFRDLKQPQMTYFRRIAPEKIPTHFRNWIYSMRADKNNMCEVKACDYDKINVISNLLVNLELGSTMIDLYVSTMTLEQTLKKISKVGIKIGKKVLIELEGWAVLELLKLYPTVYNKTVEHFNTTRKVCIPLQYFLMDSHPLNLSQFDDSTYIYCEFDGFTASMSCSFECTTLQEEERKRMAFCASETYAVHYDIKKHTLVNQKTEVVLDMPVLIRDIVVVTNGEEITVSLEGIKLLRGDDPALTYWSVVVPSKNSYYHRSTLIRTFESPDTINNQVVTGFIHGNKDNKLVIELDESYKTAKTVHVIVKYDTVLANPDKKLVFGYSPTKIVPNYDNYYPLTKNEDGSFTEGYWFSNYIYDEKAHSYPFPKQTDTTVDKKFLDKLELLTVRDAKKEQFFGCSDCRICQKPNGGDEYTLEKDKQVFKYPEGLEHYYRVHNVQPSKEFFDFVLNF